MVIQKWKIFIHLVLKKKRNVLKQIFEFTSFFCAMFSFWDMVDFVFKIRKELGTYWDFWTRERDSEKQTSDTREPVG